MNALIKVCDHLVESAALLDHHGRYLYLNRAAERLIGRSRYEVIGKSYLEVFPNSTEVPFQPAFERALTAKGAERFEAHLESLNRWFDVELYPLDTTVFVLWSDASERKKAESALAQSCAQLDTYREQVGDFSEMLRASLALDLGDPIKEIAELAKGLTQAKDSAQIARILARTQRMARVVALLSDLSRLRLESGIVLSRKTVDLSAIARSVVEELRHAHPHCSASCESRGNAVGQWDADRLHQAVFNLAESALEHDDAGAIIFRIDGTAADGIALTVAHSGTQDESAEEEHVDHARELVRYFVQHVVVAHGGTFHMDHPTSHGTEYLIHLARTEPPRFSQAKNTANN